MLIFDANLDLAMNSMEWNKYMEEIGGGGTGYIENRLHLPNSGKYTALEPNSTLWMLIRLPAKKIPGPLEKRGYPKKRCYEH